MNTSEHEIKFRVIYKNKINGYEQLSKEGWIWMCLELNPDKGERWSRGAYPDSSNSNYRRVQFTGLKDKNGNEIYEGDIVRFKHPNTFPKKEWTAEVVYDSANASFGMRGGNTYIKGIIEPFAGYDDIEDLLPFIEVIGNVFENKNLLEQWVDGK